MARHPCARAHPSAASRSLPADAPAAGAFVDDEPRDFRLARRLEDAGQADLDPALDTAADLGDEKAVVGMVRNLAEPLDGILGRHRVAERGRERRQSRRIARPGGRTTAFTRGAPGAGARSPVRVRWIRAALASPRPARGARFGSASRRLLSDGQARSARDVLQRLTSRRPAIGSRACRSSPPRRGRRSGSSRRRRGRTGRPETCCVSVRDPDRRGDARADGVAVGLSRARRASRARSSPARSSGSEDARGTAVLDEDHVEVAVAVEVGVGRSPARRAVSRGRRNARRAARSVPSPALR